MDEAYKGAVKSAKTKAKNSQNNVKNNTNETYNGDVSHSLKNNSKTSRESYTEKEYRNFGWARANNILNAGQNEDYRSKFAAAKTGNSTFNKSKNGEYIIPVSNIYDNELEGIENVLVFAKGTITNPIITSVILINADNETDLSLIREYIYEREREGIQTEIEGLFKRYNSSDREFERQKGASGVTHSERHENGSGSSTENSSVKEKTKVSYSLKDKWHTDLSKSEMKKVMEWLHKAGNPTEKRITDTACWYNGRINGKDLFVIYSTEDSSGPTILYEVKGKNAKLELNILLDLLEEIENVDGKRTHSDGKSIFAQRLSQGNWLPNVNGSQNNIQRLGTGANNQNVGVLQKQSKRRGSGAFENVITDLFGKQGEVIPEQTEINHSLKGGIKINSHTPKLLDTIEDLQNGKKGAADRLAKYVDDGMISTEAYEEMIEKYGAIKKGEKQNNLWIVLKTYTKHKNTRHFTMTGVPDCIKYKYSFLLLSKPQLVILTAASFASEAEGSVKYETDVAQRLMIIDVLHKNFITTKLTLFLRKACIKHSFLYNAKQHITHISQILRLHSLCSFHSE